MSESKPRDPHPEYPALERAHVEALREAMADRSDAEAMRRFNEASRRIDLEESSRTTPQERLAALRSLFEYEVDEGE